jgi:hypothetical protein
MKGHIESGSERTSQVPHSSCGGCSTRRHEIHAEVQGKIRGVREEASATEVFDAGESSEADIQDDIEFALIQMKSETLNKIEDVYALEQGTYGNCFECGEDAESGFVRYLRCPVQGLRRGPEVAAARAPTGRAWRIDAL